MRAWRANARHSMIILIRDVGYPTCFIGNFKILASVSWSREWLRLCMLKTPQNRLHSAQACSSRPSKPFSYIHVIQLIRLQYSVCMRAQNICRFALSLATTSICNAQKRILATTTKSLAFSVLCTPSYNLMLWLRVDNNEIGLETYWDSKAQLFSRTAVSPAIKSKSNA